MGLRELFGRKALSASPDVLEALQQGQANFNIALGVSQEVRAAWLRSQGGSYAYMYSHQPAVRAVVDYIAQNFAQLGMKLYERRSDTERIERGEHPAAELLRKPNPNTPGRGFIADVVTDFLVYSNAYILKIRPPEEGQGPPTVLLSVPPHAVAVIGSNRYTLDGYRIYREDGSFFDVSPDDMIHWRSSNPSDPRLGVSKLETLRQILSEESASVAASVELLQSGLGRNGMIERPLEAPPLSGDALKRLQEDLAAQAKDSGRHWPILEEGMTFAEATVSPKDAEMLEGRRFTREEVARAYLMEHCPPEDEEERRQFYADVLPPLTASLTDYLGLQLLSAEWGADDLYLEVDLDSKRMSDDRLKALTSAAGAPILDRNEARAYLDLPAKEGADELVVPLNVTEGGKPSPQIMPIQNPLKPPQDGSHREELPAPAGQSLQRKVLIPGTRRHTEMARQRRHIDEVRGQLERFYRRQVHSLWQKWGKAVEFDAERWNRELATDLTKVIRRLVEKEGGIYVARLGGIDFDARQVENYTASMAEHVAGRLNRVTQRDFEGDLTARESLERAIGMRAAIEANQIGAKATVFARQEAAKQSPNPERRMQTWVANTERHANLDGATVPLDSDWGGIEPGSEANCACTAVID